MTAPTKPSLFDAVLYAALLGPFLVMIVGLVAGMPFIGWTGRRRVPVAAVATACLLAVVAVVVLAIALHHAAWIDYERGGVP